MRRTGNWLSVILCLSCIFCCLLACAAYGFTWLADPQYVSGKPPIVLCILVDGVPQQPSEVLSEEDLTFQLRYYVNGEFGNIVTDTDKFDDPLPHTDKLRVRWNFGDGDTVVEEKVEATTTHSFKKTGMLTVSWSILDLALDQYSNYQANANDGPNGSRPCSVEEAKLCTVHWDAEGSFALSVGPSVSLSIDPGTIPRDNKTEATATATVTYKGSPVAGKTVSFSIQSGPGVIIAPVTATTNAEGKATAKVKSSDIAASDASVKVRATVLQGNYAEVDLTVAGLAVDLSTQYPKIYIGNETYRYETEITSTVSCPNHPALIPEGKVTFATPSGGFYVPPQGSPDELQSTVDVNLISGEAKAMLRPGSVGCINTVTATLGPLSDTVDVKFAKQSRMWEYNEPNKKKSLSAIARFMLYDQWDEYWPQAKVTVSWGIPKADGSLNYFKSAPIYTLISEPANPETGADAIASGAAQSDGWGQAQTLSIKGSYTADPLNVLFTGGSWLPYWELDDDYPEKFAENALKIERENFSWWQHLILPALAHYIFKD